MNPILVENGILCVWVLLLALMTRRNGNLYSILVLMLIPKVLDVVFLTPMLQGMKSGEFRHYFYLIHSLNDLLMCLLLLWRPVIYVFTGWRVCYERLLSEWLIIVIYFCSIAINLLVFTEYEESKLGLKPSLFFYTNYKILKGVLNYAEICILTWLTIQTIIAVRMLKKQGLIK
jgi:hypothetical protein